MDSCLSVGVPNLTSADLGCIPNPTEGTLFHRDCGPGVPDASCFFPKSQSRLPSGAQGLHAARPCRGPCSLGAGFSLYTPGPEASGK